MSERPIPSGDSLGIADCCVVGVLSAGLLGLLQLKASGYLYDLLPSVSVVRLSFLGQVLWIHIGFGVIIGAGGFTACRLLRILGIRRRLQQLAVGAITGLVLALPAREWFRFIGLQNSPILSRLIFTVIVVGASVTLTIGVSILLSGVFRRRSLPMKLCRIGAGAFVLLALGCSIGWRTIPERYLGRNTGDPDIILISLDTVRADHLEMYGYSRPTSPHLNRFAKDALVFASAFAPEPWTLPSHMSMMTSLYPIVHGVRARNARLNPQRTTLAEVLRESGYTSTAFVAKGPESWIGGLRGFADGFRRYHHPPHRDFRASGTSLLRVLNSLSRIAPGTAEDVTAGALHFLALRPTRPFFLFLHYYDAHSDFRRLPYEAPPHLLEVFESRGQSEFDGCDEQGHCASSFLGQFSRCHDHHIESDVLESIVAHYDASIRYIDGYLGELFDTLKSMNLYDQSLIIIAADHGEEFLEHGRFLHGQLYGESVHVPLLVKLPNQEYAGTRVTDPVELIDLMPTVLDVVGARHVGEMQGRSLLPYLAGHAPIDRRLFFSNTEQGGEFRTREISVQTRNEKLIVALFDQCPELTSDPEVHYYDLQSDPGEQDNVEREQVPASGEDLRSQLMGWYRDSQHLYERFSVASEERIDVSEEEIERLKSLGYIGD